MKGWNEAGAEQAFYAESWWCRTTRRVLQSSLRLGHRGMMGSAEEEVNVGYVTRFNNKEPVIQLEIGETDIQF
jgi:hypothetical protein